VTIGFLLYILMTELVAMATVGAYIARQGGPWWHTLGLSPELWEMASRRSRQRGYARTAVIVEVVREGSGQLVLREVEDRDLSVLFEHSKDRDAIRMARSLRRIQMIDPASTDGGRG
jgi:hypothetical protein